MRDLSGIITERLGRPFQWGGRGPHAYDCLGLWLEVAREALGVELHDPLAQVLEPELRPFLAQFLRLPPHLEPEPVDILFSRWSSRRQPHIVTVESERWGATVEEGPGVVRIPLEEARRRAQAIYRLREATA